MIASDAFQAATFLGAVIVARFLNKEALGHTGSNKAGSIICMIFSFRSALLGLEKFRAYDSLNLYRDDKA